VLIDRVLCDLFEVEKLAFEVELVFARLRCVALLKSEPDFSGSGAGLDSTFVFVRDRLLPDLIRVAAATTGKEGAKAGYRVYWDGTTPPNLFSYPHVCV
jgi:hypothetical protein